MILGCPFFLAAQEVYNSSGGTAIAGNTEMSYAIGEPITSTAPGNTAILTQGFLQPEQGGWKEVGTIDIAGQSWQFGIYPNPTAGFLILSSETPSPATLNIRLYGADGRLVLTDQLAQGEMAITIDLRNFGAGWYCLSLAGENGQIIGSVEVIKE